MICYDRTEETFDAWAATLGLPNVYPHELRTKCDRPLNALPPLHLLGNIVLPAQLVQRARTHFGRPVAIHSTYRAIPYNRSKASPDTSRHVFFNAIDHHIEGVNHRHLLDWYAQLREAGAFAGGLGLYSWGVHIDTRGYNTEWGV